jgi:MFS family permease
VRQQSVWRRFWSATSISMLGDGMVEGSALALLAATMTRDPTLVAGVLFATRLPWLLFGLFSGAVVDRVNRMVLIAATDLARGLLIGLLAVLVAIGSVNLPLLYAVAFMVGLCRTLFDNAAMATVPALVPVTRLERANGWLFGIETVSFEFLGPLFGSMLFVVAASIPFYLDAGALVVAAVLTATIVRRVPVGHPAPMPRTSILADIGEGLRWLWRHKLLRILAAMTGIIGFMEAAILAVLVLYSLQVLHLSNANYGVLLAAGGLGGILGFVSAPAVRAKLAVRHVIVGVTVIGGISYLAMGLGSLPVLTAVMYAVNRMAVGLWDVVTVSLRQAIIPTHIFGRVNSVYRLVGWGSMSLGALGGGLLVHFFGLRGPFVVAALTMVVTGVVAIPVLRRHAAEYR